MSHFPSLPDSAHLSDLFRRFPKGLEPLLRLHDALLREASEFSIAERELIAAYVSGLNQCAFCYGAHKVMARAFGVDEALFDALFGDLENAPVSDAMKPVLRFVRKLTETPSAVVKADAQAVLDAGWSEDALYDAAAICALYNYMNRILDGAGIKPGPEYDAPDEKMLSRRRSGTYMDWGRSAGLLPGAPANDAS